MTNAFSRRRVLLAMVAVFAPVDLLGSVFTPRHRIVTAVLLTVMFASFIGVVLAVFRFRPGWTTGGPMRELGTGDRACVGRAVRRGEATDARLGAAVVQHGRRMVALNAFVAVDCLVLAVPRMTSLGGDSGAADRAVDLAAAVLWIGIAVESALRFARARRAVTVAGVSTVSTEPAP